MDPKVHAESVQLLQLGDQIVVKDLFKPPRPDGELSGRTDRQLLGPWPGQRLLYA